MTFLEWLLSSYPNPSIEGQYGLPHILTLLFIALFVVFSSLILKNKSHKTKRIVLLVIASIILTFEITRRIINLIRMPDRTLLLYLKTILPRPGCAISCWLVIIAVYFNKGFLYNIASIIGILCGVIFFAYPGAGFNNQYMLFENVYSIVTHTLFTSACFCFITYKFTDFDYKNIKKELICLLIIAVYVVIEILFKIEPDPFYFMPNNEVQEIIGLNYPAFIVLYAIFVVVYFNAYYLITKHKNLFTKKVKSN